MGGFICTLITKRIKEKITERERFQRRRNQCVMKNNFSRAKVISKIGRQLIRGV